MKENILSILATDVARGVYAYDAVGFQKDLDAAIATATRKLREQIRPLEDFRETAAMYCERLPAEVRESLHAIPGIEKTHFKDRLTIRKTEKK